MARIAKSKDQANWRKGKDLQVGDIVILGSESGWVDATITGPAEKVPYMSVTNYQFPTSIEGRFVTVGGGEFVRGRYQV